MNYLSNALRYVAGADDDKQGEVGRLLERVRSSSLVQDRCSAVLLLNSAALSDPLRKAEIGESGLSVFFTVLNEDSHYKDSINAVMDLLITLCSSADVNADKSNILGNSSAQNCTAQKVASSNVNVLISLPGALLTVVRLLKHIDFHIRCAAVELLTAMASNAQPTMQAAILDTMQGINTICDLLDDASHVIRSNSVLLLSVLCSGSPEVSNIIAFSGVPDKLIEMIDESQTSPSDLTASERDEPIYGSLEAAIMAGDVLQLLESIIQSSETTRAALREVSTICGIVGMLAQATRYLRPIVEISSSLSTSESFEAPLRSRRTRNVFVCVSIISNFVRGDPGNVKQAASFLAGTDILSQLQSLVFLHLVDEKVKNMSSYRDLTRIRVLSLQVMATLVKMNTAIRQMFYSSVYPAAVLQTATPQMCALHTMLHDDSLALRSAGYLAFRESFLLDTDSGVQSFCWSSSGVRLVHVANSDTEDNSDEDDISIPSTYVDILVQYLHDALFVNMSSANELPLSNTTSADEMTVCNSSALLSWTFLSVTGVRERLLASHARDSDSSLLALTMRVLAGERPSNVSVSVRIALLTMVCSWLLRSPSTVSEFLSQQANVSILFELLRSATELDATSSMLVKGLASYIFFLLLASNMEDDIHGEDRFINGGRWSINFFKDGLADTVRDRVGIRDIVKHGTAFKEADRLSNFESSVDLWRLASEILVNSNENGMIANYAWYDVKLIDIVKGMCNQVASHGLLLLSNATVLNKEKRNILVNSELTAADEHAKDVLSFSHQDSPDLKRTIIRLPPKNSTKAESQMSSSESSGDTPNCDCGITEPPFSARRNKSVSRLNTGDHSEVFRSELEETVRVLNSKLSSKCLEQQALLDELEVYRKNETDWRQQFEESRRFLQADAAKRQELAHTINDLKRSALLQSEEIALSNRHVCELEERCADLTEMRKRAEEQVVVLRGEVATRVEHSVEVSSLLFEAQERISRLEDESKRLKSDRLNALSSQQKGAVQRDLDIMRSDLQAARELNERLQASAKGTDSGGSADLNRGLAKLSSALSIAVKNMKMLSKQFKSEKSAAVELKKKCVSIKIDRAKAEAGMVFISRSLAEKVFKSEKHVGDIATNQTVANAFKAHLLSIMAENESLAQANSSLKLSLKQVRQDQSLSNQAWAKKTAEFEVLADSARIDIERVRLENANLRRSIDVTNAQPVRQPSASFVSALNDKIVQLSTILNVTMSKSIVLSRNLLTEKRATLEEKEKCQQAERDRAKATAGLSSVSKALSEKQVEFEKLLADAAENKSFAISEQEYLKQVRAEKDVLFAKISRLEIAQKDSRDKALSLSQDLTAKVSECRSLVSDAVARKTISDSLRAQLCELGAERDAQAAEKDGLETSLSSLGMKLSSVSRALSRKESECSKLVNDATTAHSRSLQLHAECDKLVKGKADLEKEVNIVRKELSVTLQSLAMKEAECEHLSMEAVSNKSIINDVRQNSQLFIREKEALSKKNANLANAVAKLEEELSTATKTLSDYAAEFKRVVIASEKEKSVLRTANIGLLKRMDAAEVQIEEMRQASKSFDKARAEARVSNEAFNELRREHDELLVCLAEVDADFTKSKEDTAR